MSTNEQEIFRRLAALETLAGSLNIIERPISSIPAVFAYRSTDQTGVLTGVLTKIVYNAEDFDIRGNFDTSNGRFTPDVVGTYLIFGGFAINNTGTVGRMILDLYQNGTDLIRMADHNIYSGAYGTASVRMNGTTDFVELYGFQTFDASGVFRGTVSGTRLSYFGALWIGS